VQPQHCLTRREFLAAASLPLLTSACSRARFGTRHDSRPERSPVALFDAPSYGTDFSDLVTRGLRELAVDVRGKRVFLKPNMVEYEAGTAINTDPLVIVGAAHAFRSAGAAEVVIGEGPGHRRDTEYLLTRTGLYDHLRECRIRFIDLNHDDVRDTPLETRYMGLRQLALPVELVASDFIVSMPKLKMHHWAGMTASMKNLFGVLPGAVYGWPKNILHVHGIDNSILDLNATVRPHFTIVDAVTAMEGDGPIMGVPRHLGMIAMGYDLPAVDATCARIIGLDPDRLPYLAEAGKFIGNTATRRIQQRGEAITRFATSFDVIDSMKALRLNSI
jgi:uncharacterized protein (DUF362 family)